MGVRGLGKIVGYSDHKQNVVEVSAGGGGGRLGFSRHRRWML